jgi:hypothetical protein
MAFKRFLTGFIVLLAVFALLGPAPAQAQLRDFWAYVYSWDGTMNSSGELNLTRITSGVTFQVLQRNSDTAETCYVKGSSTSLTNPVTTTNFAAATACDDQVAFRTDPGETNDLMVDLIVVDTAGGYTAFVEDFSEQVHTIVIDQRPNVMHQGTIWFNFAAGSATEIDTGIDFDYDTMIHDVRSETVTTDASATIDVGILSSGTNGDADGLLDGRLLTTAGYTADTGVITGGTTIDYSPDSTYGALLYTIVAGEDDDVAEGGGRTHLGHPVVSANEQSLTYTLSAGTDTGIGYIHYFFTRMR